MPLIHKGTNNPARGYRSWRELAATLLSIVILILPTATLSAYHAPKSVTLVVGLSAILIAAGGSWWWLHSGRERFPLKQSSTSTAT